MTESIRAMHINSSMPNNYEVTRNMSEEDLKASTKNRDYISVSFPEASSAEIKEIRDYAESAGIPFNVHVTGYSRDDEDD